MGYYVRGYIKDNGTENLIMGYILGKYKDNGKENANYYLIGLRVCRTFFALRVLQIYSPKSGLQLTDPYKTITLMNPHDKCTRNRSRIVSNMLRTSRLGSLARRGATRSACFSSSSSKSGASGVTTIFIVDTPGRYKVGFGPLFVVCDSSAASTTAIYGAIFLEILLQAGLLSTVRTVPAGPLAVILPLLAPCLSKTQY